MADGLSDGELTDSHNLVSMMATITTQIVTTEMEMKKHTIPDEDWKTVDSINQGIVWSVELPSSIFSVAPIITLTCAEHEIFRCLFRWLPYWVLMYMALFIQAYILFRLNDALDDAGSCDRTPALLQFIALSIFTTKVWEDLWESFKMMSYFVMMPTANTWVDANVFVVSPYTGKAERLDQGRGITNRFRVVIFVGIVLPKIAVAVALLFIGCRFLLQAQDSEDLIKDCTALLFVFEIDDYIHDGICTDSAKSQIEKFPTFEISSRDMSESRHLNDADNGTTATRECCGSLIKLISQESRHRIMDLYEDYYAPICASIIIVTALSMCLTCETGFYGLAMTLPSLMPSLDYSFRALVSLYLGYVGLGPIVDTTERNSGRGLGAVVTSIVRMGLAFTFAVLISPFARVTTVFAASTGVWSIVSSVRILREIRTAERNYYRDTVHVKKRLVSCLLCFILTILFSNTIPALISAMTI